jgi:hypothetical protein
VGIDNRRGGAEAYSAAIIDVQRVARRTGLDGERRPTAVDIVDGELVGAAVRRVIGGELPVIRGKTGRGARVLELDPQAMQALPSTMRSSRMTWS